MEWTLLPLKEHLDLSDQKPWITKEVCWKKGKLPVWWWSTVQSVWAKPKRGIREAKVAYRRTTSGPSEDHLSSNNVRQVWQGVQHMTSYKASNVIIAERPLLCPFWGGLAIDSCVPEIRLQQLHPYGGETWDEVILVTVNLMKAAGCFKVCPASLATTWSNSPPDGGPLIPLPHSSPKCPEKAVPASHPPVGFWTLPRDSKKAG